MYNTRTYYRGSILCFLFYAFQENAPEIYGTLLEHCAQFINCFSFACATNETISLVLFVFHIFDNGAYQHRERERARKTRSIQELNRINYQGNKMFLFLSKVESTVNRECISIEFADEGKIVR